MQVRKKQQKHREQKCHLNDAYCIVVLDSNNDKSVQIPRSCEQLYFWSSGSLTNFSHYNGKLGQLPVLLTTFPPVSVSALFILCFFLYKSIRQAHFKQPALQFTLYSVALSHLSWFPCVGKGLILTCSSASQTFLSVFPGCTAAFLHTTSWKNLFMD